MTFDQWMRSVLERVETALGHYLPAETVAPAQLHEAMRYAALGGGNGCVRCCAMRRASSRAHRKRR